jgi:hypothetical protein
LISDSAGAVLRGARAEEFFFFVEDNIFYPGLRKIICYRGPDYPAAYYRYHDLEVKVPFAFLDPGEHLAELGIHCGNFRADLFDLFFDHPLAGGFGIS